MNYELAKNKGIERILTLSSSPHIRDKTTVARIMRAVIIALSPGVAASIYFFGLRAVELILVCSLSSVTAEYLFLKIRGKGVSGGPSALLTGLLLALILPPSFPLWGAALGAIFAVVIGKQIFGGLGYNIFNPALIGRAFLVATFPVLMTTWLRPFTLDAVTTATPLGLLRFQSQSTPVLPLFLGNVAGSLGETSSLALLIGGAYLLLKRYIDWRIPLSYLSSVALLSTIFYLIDPLYGAPSFHLFAGGLMIGALFMATDPVTSPLTKQGRWIFGLGAGIIVVIIRRWGGYPEGVMFSILLMNAFTPLMDRYIKPKTFGGR
ncbi:RnfABCDGE type electron transport complex subunit D [Candidatus Aerophobetes bacterium]|uniref:Ion-translocating oxidoreductase complex subunit D n=1 Tax=Aerophobetes bacterium TaxID=2030807 RepID=A0A523RQ44_UNCAE|nr:MAG: RnfABCDGE type electron transport complex subunit D [Candidatus Aerophobetes bacterium]